MTSLKRISEFAANTRPLDTRDRTILLTVWAAWRDCKTLTIRDLRTPTGLQLTAVWQRLRRLKRDGWLAYEDLISRSLRPGPRFAGVDHGRILQPIGKSTEAPRQWPSATDYDFGSYRETTLLAGTAGPKRQM